MGRHLAVGIGTGQPDRTLFDHLRRAGTARHADVAGVYIQCLHTMAPGHRRTAITAAVQHHQYLDLITRQLGLSGGGPHGLEAATQAARFVVGRNDHRNHKHVSSRSTTLGWQDQYSSRKSASSWR
ncbi:hypothetical protein D3C81_1025780 [compost metagenome]